MSTIKKSRSYPETIYDSHIRETKHLRVLTAEYKEEKKRLQYNINNLRIKDYNKAQKLANLGSPSSCDFIIPRKTCCDVMGDVISYFLEREESSRIENETIQKKSYAGFYYFIKWFTRSLFFLVFTTLGSIAGKEIGCEIKSHSTCKSSAIQLAGNSPHIISTITGSVFGLIIGQWLGRFIWDKLVLNIRKCLRFIEKRADNTKSLLFLTSIVVYILITSLFFVIFYLFVHIGSRNIIGGVVGGCTGLILAVLAYRKSSSCVSGQVSETPMINCNTAEPDIPEIVLNVNV